MSRRRGADVALYTPLAAAYYGAQIEPGGAELQSVAIARTLARGGLRVRHIVSGLDARVSPDGVEVVPLPAGYELPGLRRRRAIVRALRDADALVYIQRTAGFETGVVGAYARLARRRFVFSASHDADFLRDRAVLRQLGSGDEVRLARAQYRLGLHCAHAVVAQTERQAQLGRQTFGLDPQVIRSFGAPAPAATAEPEAFLWVGAFIDVKDPLAYVALAEALPHIPFRMVGTDRALPGRSLAAAVRERAGGLPNLELLPPRPHAELASLYERAFAIVGTSRLEGFPNVFLEAWARGVPAVSLRLDPDGLIARHGLGVAAGGSLEVAAHAIRDYHEQPAAAREAGAAARRYVATVHAPEVVGPHWLELVRRLLAGVR